MVQLDYERSAKMRQIEVTSILAVNLLAIAREAGQGIMRIYAQRLDAAEDSGLVLLSEKADHSPLTQADLLAHHLVSAALAQLTPAIPVVSEEQETSWRHRRAAGEFWLVDPLDGTKEFLAQNGEFTVNIALVRDGRAVLGIVVAPALGLSYWGGEGLGAFRELHGKVDTLQVANDIPPDRPLRIVASKSHLNEDTLAFISRLGQYELIRAGSSLKFCRIAEGSADVYPRLAPTCEWDTAAAQAIVEAAGGYVSTLDDTALSYGKESVLNPSFVASAVPLATLLSPY
jgi:3'(2'), 5'-bisphosphate nucleotidase